MFYLRDAVLAMLATASLVAAQGAGGLPQCVKGEYGCEMSGQAPPTFGHVTNFARSVGITRYKSPPGTSGENCAEGDEVGYKVAVHKGQCVTFGEWPYENMTINYKLPNNKLLNHCDITMFDGKDCRGLEVWKMYGSMDVQTVNGQRYCHKTPWAKSVYVGPCT